MNNENKNNNKNENNNKKVKSQKLSKGSKLWIIKVSTLAFFVSLLLSLFSEIIQQRSSVVFAIILLIIFMALNVLSDMLGLAITSCQIERLSREVSDKNVYDKCINLIKNSDKVSSILCDVVGDVCGILCGVSGSMISILLSKNISLVGFGIFVSAFLSGLIAMLTVLFKAISKNFAMHNAHKIVKKISTFLIKFSSKKK